MNKSKLIFTSTVGMPREEWLAFRQPITHIKKFVVDTWNAAMKPTPKDLTVDQFFNQGPFTYAALQTVFNNKAWKDFIFPCIGASEQSTIMGLNPYKSIIELYFEKTGAKPVYDFDNVAMFWGRELEEQIADKWEFWDGSPEGMIANFVAKNQIRKCRRVNAYIQNKECPWIFVSPDRVINKQHLSDEEVINEGSLECKTISGFAAGMWESGIPPMYVSQLQTQLLVCDFQYGEIAILKDGRQFEVHPFDRHEKIVNGIHQSSSDFFELVKKGAEAFLLHSYATTDEDKQLHYAELERLAPEPDGSESYRNYLSEKYTSDQADGLQGGILQASWAKDYKFYAKKIDGFKELQTLCTNKLKDFMKESPKLDLGLDGNVTWKNDSRGTRTMRVNVKIEEGYQPAIMQPTLEEAVSVKEVNIQQRVNDLKNLGFDEYSDKGPCNFQSLSHIRIIQLEEVEKLNDSEWFLLIAELSGAITKKEVVDVPFVNDEKPVTKRTKKVKSE